MDLRNLREQPLVRDLTRTRHMTTVAAVILATIFMPLLGVPNVEQLRVVQLAVEGFADSRAAAITPRRDDEAARERMMTSVVGEREEDGSSMSFADRVLTVIRPARQEDEALDVADITPLPPVEDPDYAEMEEPIAEDEEVFPELVEEPEEVLPEDEYYEEEQIPEDKEF
jgi:hypothetical protein